jgi:hypothetical protein
MKKNDYIYFRIAAFNCHHLNPRDNTTMEIITQTVTMKTRLR